MALVRTMRLLTLLATVLAISAGVAFAASPGVLSGPEYQQLVLLQSQYNAKSLKTLSSLEAGQTTCNRMAPVSALVGAERADCRDGFAWLISSVRIESKIKGCARGATVNRRLGCLLPYYAKLSVTVRALHNADAYVNHVASGRHFNKTCVRALGDSPKAIAAEGRMAKDASRLVSAIRSRNLLSVQKYGGLYDADTAEAVSDGSKLPLSVCPHS
jgi:hypothetical protein